MCRHTHTRKTRTHRKHHDTQEKHDTTHQANKHPHTDNCQHSPHESTQKTRKPSLIHKEASNHKHKCKHTHTHQKQKQHTLEISVGCTHSLPWLTRIYHSQKITHLLRSLAHVTRRIGQNHVIRNACILEPTFEWSCLSQKSDGSQPQAV